MSDVATRREVVRSVALYLGIEVGDHEWKLGFTIGLGQAPRIRSVRAGDRLAVLSEIGRAKRRFGLGDETTVFSCYEAGRSMFWPHRALQEFGVRNVVVDSSSIEVSRRMRRAKTDRLDAAKLSQMLVRYHAGEDRLWRVVRVPSPADEDLRHLHRELITLRRECGRATSRIKGLLATQGVHVDGAADLDQVCCWDGSPLPRFLLARARAEETRLKLVRDQVHTLERERVRLLKELPPQSQALIGKLMRLKGIGIETAWLLVMEFFGWRRFANLKQLGALAGLTPTPHQSGELSRELGISKSGNRLVRWILVEAAWSWVRWQPESELTRWYEKRFGDGSKRMRRIGCVALARKLLCALWKYVDADQLPAGAILKA